MAVVVDSVQDPTELYDIFESISPGYSDAYRALENVTAPILIRIVPNQREIPLQNIHLQIKKQYNNCANIARYEQSFRADEYIWTIMEYFGHSCLDFMRHTSHQTFTEKMIKIIMRQTLIALAYLHENKLIHRNIKASSILINHKGIVKLGMLCCVLIQTTR